MQQLKKMNPQGPQQTDCMIQQQPVPKPHVHGPQCKSTHSKQKRMGIIYYTIFTCLSCLYLETQQLNPLLNDKASRYMTLLSYFDVFMCLWSYFQTMRITNTLPHLSLSSLYYPLQAKLDEDPLSIYSKRCQQCTYYKLPRVSHCNSCGVCVYRMDHHCMWTQTCIGYRNYRPFFLFCIYMSVGVMQFWYSTVRVAAFGIKNGTFFSTFDPAVYVLWAITCISAAVVGVMIIVLTIGQLLMSLTNYTTLDTIKRKKCFAMPFIQFRTNYLSADNVNPYDMGEIANMKSIFGNNFLTFWMPLARQFPNDVLPQPSHPVPGQLEISKITGQFQESVKRSKELEIYTAKGIAMIRNANTKMIINGKIFTCQ